MIDQAIVMAESRGGHLGALTRDRPLPMLPVLGKPMAVRVMERLRDAGVRRFVIILGEDCGQVAAYLSSSWYPDLELSFIPQVMSSGGLSAAIKAAAQQLDGPFFLIGSDVLTPQGYLNQLTQRFELAEKDLIVSLGQVRFSRGGSYFPAAIDGDALASVAVSPTMPAGAEYGVFLAYACAPDMLPYLTGERKPLYREQDLAVVLQHMIDADRPVGYALADWYHRLMTADDLLAVNRHLLGEGRDAHILSELPGTVQVAPPVRIDPGVSVGQGARLGPHVYLEAGSMVGPGAALKNAVVLAGAAVHAGEQVSGRLVYQEGASS